MKTTHIRKAFLDFFSSQQHAIIASDSLVPKDDPTVLFTTAGMQQFKKYFLGQANDLKRAVTSQKCLRTDDLDQVGHTAFHHTFFEMLGNFSFGDYFKREAILWAWEFLTGILGLPKEKLWVSVYHQDNESEAIWINDIQIHPQKLIKLGDKNNFWPSQARTKGPNGPCGPCSEIFYDYGKNPNCLNQSCNPECDCGRFSEIWNLVFTQFIRKDGGILEPLPAKNIDTGMGLERLAAILQKKKTNFEIDLFEPIMRSIEDRACASRITLSRQEKNIMADHLRAIVFSIADGVIPSNEGRGYVVKKLITDITDILLEKSDSSFVHQLVPSVISAMKDPYKDLIDKEKNIIAWVQKTENAYAKVRAERIPDFKKAIQTTKNSLGKIIFQYRDTYGLTMAAAKGVMVRMGLDAQTIEHSLKEAEKYMNQQRQKSRAASKMTGDVFLSEALTVHVEKTKFIGEDFFESPAQILKILSQNNTEIQNAHQDDNVKIVLDQTPFYAEAGGQQGDTGLIRHADGVIKIRKTYKINDVFIHEGIIDKGSFTQGQAVDAKIDITRRFAIMRNHTATHLLQSSLRKILGSHISQQGSLVAEDRLRFDFTHPKALTAQELTSIEDDVNQRIRACLPVSKKEISLSQAQKEGALAFFAEKYDQSVRVVTMGDASKELCGGTHVRYSGEIGMFKIVHESAVAQGIRRIEGVTGEAAIKHIHDLEKIILSTAQALKSPVSDILPRLNAQQKKIKNLEKKLSEMHFSQLTSSFQDLIDRAKTIEDVLIVTDIMEDVDIDTLKKFSDMLKQKIQTAVITLVSRSTEGSFMIVAVTDDLVKKNIKANELIGVIAPLIKAKGGGRPNLAQAGSKETQHFTKAFTTIERLIQEKLSQ